MKKLLFTVSLLWSGIACAQFTPGQVLTAAQLNSQFALYAQLLGATFLGPVTIPSLTVTGTAILPSGSVPLSGLGAQAANTVVANSTASTASPTAFTMPSCSTSSSALTWTTGSGFTCNTSVNASTLGGATFASPGAIGSGTASTGNFTGLVASGTVSGTGFVNLLSPYALLASPTFTGTPSAPTAAATTNTTQIATTGMVNSAITGGSLAGSFTSLASSGAYTPSQTNGIVGTTTNNNANAGSVGEYICAQVTNGGTPTGCVTNSNTPVSLTTNTTANITSISLTAGDWMVCGDVGTVPAGTTTQINFISGISTTSATLPTPPNFGAYVALPYATNTAGNFIASPVGCMRQSLASTTTVYLVLNVNFGVSTDTGYGSIWGRRIR